MRRSTLGSGERGPPPPNPLPPPNMTVTTLHSGKSFRWANNKTVFTNSVRGPVLLLHQIYSLLQWTSSFIGPSSLSFSRCAEHVALLLSRVIPCCSLLVRSRPQPHYPSDRRLHLHRLLLISSLGLRYFSRGVRRGAGMYRPHKHPALVVASTFTSSSVVLLSIHDII